MKQLLLDVESVVVNLFQTGFSSVNEAVVTQVEEMASVCNRYRLEVLGSELLDLGNLLKEVQTPESRMALTQRTLHLVRCVDLLGQRVTYDDLGGY